MDNRIELQYRIAVAFLEVGAYSNARDKEFSKQSLQFISDAYYAMPSLVNLAFSCELFLKTILTLNNIKFTDKDGHHLKLLYDKVPSEIKNILTDNFKKKCKYKISFEETMEYHDSTFVQFRYIYEEKNKKAYGYPDNLQLAAEIMDEYLSNN